MDKSHCMTHCTAGLLAVHGDLVRTAMHKFVATKDLLVAEKNHAIMMKESKHGCDQKCCVQIFDW
jgi:hypothetical protein